MKAALSSLLLVACLHCSAKDNNYEKGLKAFDAKDYKTALALLTPYADDGSCLAQYAVGYCYSREESGFENDSLAEIYLSGAAQQKQTHAMGLLATLYFKKSYTNKSYAAKALLWAELAAEYDIVQKSLSTRYVIRQYMSKPEIEDVEIIIAERKEVFNKMEICSN